MIERSRICFINSFTTSDSFRSILVETSAEQSSFSSLEELLQRINPLVESDDFVFSNMGEVLSLDKCQARMID